ncbi:hypothetical protein NQ317_011519 [Molorchus minor]|uniref:Uncharacterized protein n=1 Tax=Molorchus minor TaxID=1323400 RepID=A0ABQ9J1X9_9CUCU|nr:hypothetical protein NQ317_011519 [Molorchus minor]
MTNSKAKDIKSYHFNRQIDRLVKQWSPLIWMSPQEKYMPLSIEEFLEHVHVADENGEKIKTSSTRMSTADSTSYLVTHQPLGTI